MFNITTSIFYRGSMMGLTIKVIVKAIKSNIRPWEKFKCLMCMNFTDGELYSMSWQGSYDICP